MAERIDLDTTDSAKTGGASPVLSESQKNRMLDLLRRAEAANQKNNYGWAAELYWQIYRMDREGHTEYFQKMIMAAMTLQTMAPSLKLFKAKALLGQVPLMLKALRMKWSPENNDDFYETHENIMKINPDSRYAALRLATAYEKAGLKLNSALILESYLRTRKGDVETMRRMGDLFLATGKLEKAREAFKKILQVKPLDPAAEKRLKDVMAQTTVDEAKLRGSAFTGSLKDADELAREQVELKVHKTEEEFVFLIEARKKAIEANPSNISLLNELLMLYKEKKDRKNTLKTIDAISQFVSGDLGLLLERLEAEIALMEEDRSAMDPSELRAHILDKQRNGYESLARQFSTSMDLKFKLGRVLFELRENDEALEYFQATEKIPDYAAASMNYKGMIFFRKKMHDMAVDEYQNAIQQLPAMNDTRKELHYNLGLTYEAMNRRDLALAEYKKIFKVDVGFRDIRSRIEASYQDGRPPEAE